MVPALFSKINWPDVHVQTFAHDNPRWFWTFVAISAVAVVSTRIAIAKTYKVWRYERMLRLFREGD
jgi:membrane protein YdbS with pleckstrin-like domain